MRRMKEEHKHTMAVKYVWDRASNHGETSVDKFGGGRMYAGAKRWIVIDYCTECTYERARDLVYELPANQSVKEKI